MHQLNKPPSTKRWPSKNRQVNMAKFPKRLRELCQQYPPDRIRIDELIDVRIRDFHRWEQGTATPLVCALLPLDYVLGLSLDTLARQELI